MNLYIKSLLFFSILLLLNGKAWTSQTNISRVTANQFRVDDKCAFPAQYAKTQKNFHVEQLSECKELYAWLIHKPRENMALVYAGSYLGNASSAFGHTFLLAWDKNPLSPISSVIDFSGDVPSATGIIDYVTGGLLGEFPGRFNITTLSNKTFSYGIKEGRSLQIFPLEISLQEIDFIWMQLWEMQQIDMNYYFLDKNCSYQIMYLLSLVKPEIALTSFDGLYTIPGDTVNYLYEKKLLKEALHIPSLNRQAAMDTSPFHPNAWLFRHYDFESDTSKDWGDAQNLVTPSKLPSTPQFITTTVVDAHSSSRIKLGISQHEQQNQPSLLLGYRPLFHAETDPQAGFDKGNAIELLAIEVSIDKNKIKIDDITLFRFRSLIPAQGFINGRLWEICLGAKRELQRSGDISLEPNLALGFGRSGDIGALSYWYTGYLNLENHQMTKTSLIPQLETGAHWTKGLWQIRYQYKVDIVDDRRQSNKTEIGYVFKKNISAHLVHKSSRWKHEKSTNITMELRHYF
jgi:hypothetical protein